MGKAEVPPKEAGKVGEIEEKPCCRLSWAGGQRSSILGLDFDTGKTYAQTLDLLQGFPGERGA